MMMSRDKIEDKLEELIAASRLNELLNKKEAEEEKREKSRQQAVVEIRKKYGKNALLKGMNYEQGATGKQRNKQIGGHKA